MILVLGYGVSGKAAVLFLKKLGLPVVAVDRRPDVNAGVLPDSADFPMDGISQVILSPGIPSTHPLVKKAKALGIEVIGEMELALRWTKNRSVGVTGSNGKTTTALLTAHVLNASGVKARAVGNVGVALSSYLLNPDPEEILIVELSSFQLETLRVKHFEFGVYLNLLPNHLDRHASMEEYARAKANLQHCLKPDGKLLVSNQVLQASKDLLQIDRVEVFEENGPFAPLFLPAQNVAAVQAIAAKFDVSEEQVVAALPSFKKPPHRIEYVAESAGVRYYNDSKATSVEAVLHALSWFSGPLVLIVGGKDKGSPYVPWIAAMQGKVKKIVAYGEAAQNIARDVGSFYAVDRVDLFSDAVAAAQREACLGDTVLLAPGCSSYDQFESYEERGDVFKMLVMGVRA